MPLGSPLGQVQQLLTLAWKLLEKLLEIAQLLLPCRLITAVLIVFISSGLLQVCALVMRACAFASQLDAVYAVSFARWQERCILNKPACRMIAYISNANRNHTTEKRVAGIRQNMLVCKNPLASHASGKSPIMPQNLNMDSI